MSPVDTVRPERESTVPALGHPARGREIKDQLARVVMWAAFLLALLPLLWILWTVIAKGAHLLLEPQWWTNSQKGITARHAGGGAIHAIQGTLIQGLTTAVISVPAVEITSATSRPVSERRTREE